MEHCTINNLEYLTHSLLKSLISPSLTPVKFLVALGLTRCNHAKYWRRLLLPAGAALVLYRGIQYSSSLPSGGLSGTFLGDILHFIEHTTKQENYHRVLNFGGHVVADSLGLFIFSQVIRGVLRLTSYSFESLKKMCKEAIFDLVKGLPPVQKQLNKEANKMYNDLERDLKSKSRGIDFPSSSSSVKGSTSTSSATPSSQMVLPKQAASAESIIALMQSVRKAEDTVWLEGRISGAVYHGEAVHQDLLNKAFSFYSLSNPLHPDVWPSCMKFESEVIAMTASLVKGNCDTVCGATTSGGTESIILAIKSHRDFYKEKFGVTSPEMICSSSAHAAVDKACDLMGIRLIKIPMNPETYQLDPHLVERAVGPNTILIYSSAPSYPQGVIDDISALSAIAVRYQVGLHVDCCLGGFFLPFAKKLGHPVPAFDFSLPGVTSMSVDTHKYGFALKGSSVVLYRNVQLRQAQYFCYADWTGGLYTTPTIAGSRSGGLIAQCWASMMALGEEGYLRHTKEILQSTKKIAEGVRGIDALRLCGPAAAMIVCFTTSSAFEGKVNIYAVADLMSKKGWSINSHQSPPCVHLCCTVRQVGKEDAFLYDLKESVESIKANPAASSHGSAAIYGMTSALPSGPVNTLLKVYNDVVLSV